MHVAPKIFSSSVISSLNQASHFADCKFDGEEFTELMKSRRPGNDSASSIRSIDAGSRRKSTYSNRPSGSIQGTASVGSSAEKRSRREFRGEFNNLALCPAAVIADGISKKGAVSSMCRFHITNIPIRKDLSARLV